MDERKPEMRPRRSGEFALTAVEVENFFRGTRSFDDVALFKVAIATGARRDDIVSIRRKDVDVEGLAIVFYERKKNRTWRAFIGPETALFLGRYIDKLPKGTQWLFPSPGNPNKHLSSRQAYNRFQSVLKIAGLPRRPFHALRATCIKLLQKNGWTIEQVMEQTGDSFRTIKEHYETPTRAEMEGVARERGL